jgi:DNA-binding NtrC family response regulator/tetratricopeptide (TPR) repeat protein
MGMRRVARGRAALEVSLRTFGWERAAVAALRHSTMPWMEGFAPEIALAAVPLQALRDLGGRDRLSLVAQFAAHQAFLQFAGIADGECDPAEWAVVQKRGSDVRLVRIAARPPNPDAPPPLTIIQQFAESISAPPLDVLRQSWARAEAVYCEVDTRLRRGAAADLRWMRQAASGEITSPGIEMLRTLLAERGGHFSFHDAACVDAVRNAALLGNERVLVLGENASPLQRHSAIEPLAALAGPLRDRRDNEIVERVIAACGEHRVILILPRSEAYDTASRSVLQMLGAIDAITWIDSSAGAELPETRYFVVSPRLGPWCELETQIADWPPSERRSRVAGFVSSTAFEHFLDDGRLPRETAELADVREPVRSYVSALALLGMRIPEAFARRFLAEFVGIDTNGHDILVDGITSLDDGVIVFASAHARDAAVALIPPTSRSLLCRVAAKAAEENGDNLRAAELLVEGGSARQAAELLEQVTWGSREQAVRALRTLPLDALTPPLRLTLANALLDSGRYRDAAEIATDELTLARIERRLGEYNGALARLEQIEDRDFDATLLRGELLYLTKRYAAAREVYAACHPVTDDHHVRLGYARAVLAIDCGESDEAEWMLVDAPSRAYLVARVESYRCEARGDAAAAMASAGRAVERARTVPEHIDALLDGVFALFSSGRWEDARAAAMRALVVIEETQGDCAAGGVLFTLAYLCADDGQWAHAAQRIARLAHFYRGTRDQGRLSELDLLAAHLDFSRGRFESARVAATAILGRALAPQVREAAALILDEIATIERTSAPMVATGGARNRELADRYALLRARRGTDSPAIVGAFTHALSAWERGLAGMPTPSTGSEWLKLFRSALAKGDRHLAESIARDAGIALEERDNAGSELRLLHAAATRGFPYSPSDFGAIGWRLATRNRLGHWSEIGPLPPLAAGELDTVLGESTRDWVTISEREVLFVDRISRWSLDSRETLCAIIRARSEQYRLQRIVEQEEAARPLVRAEAVEGIVGQSAVMRDVFALISRVAKRDVPVCVLGESGTGKELVARAIHRNSARRSKPFTAVNCAALPENLIESELFGHIRGAFTGADRDRLGLIETTDNGTLFLDEIGELPLAAQAKLLRFLQEGEFRRVGDTNQRTVDVRIVTATNRKLEAAVEDGRFREDLYYRIRVVEIVLPPLRNRDSDVVLLATHFLAAERDKHRSGAASFTPEAEGAIASYAWPGNVRELQNTVRAAHALAGEGKVVDLEHLPERVRAAAGVRPAASSYHDALTRFRRELIERSLAQVKGNQNQAAALLKISRQALAYQIRELGIMVRSS